MSGTLILVEGRTDKAFIRVVAERLNIARKIVKILPMDGNRPEKAYQYLRTYRREFERAIVLKDVHRAGIDRTPLIERLASRIKQLEEEENIQVCVLPVRRSIEAWILAGLSQTNPEDILDPVEELKKVMWRRGRQYVKSPEVYKRLAKEIDIEKALSLSRTFKDFVDLLSKL